MTSNFDHIRLLRHLPRRVPYGIMEKVINMEKFFERVYALVACVPRGRAASYGQIAAMLGAPHCARQVGWAMRVCPDELPWQRIVRSDGSVAGGDHAQLRRALLESEGIPFLPNGRVDMKKCQWPGLGGEEHE